ncbi:pentapeptide repeat-containing protein [Nodosilinea sp. PGN35]|uniref:pentapeptide repeat-containing protein n=1 Tax=Nodosilinea sp. PGN35 TaxID=3020489 RepID=UPI0023B2A9B1|nr:pentapeptide repeat-containing protein [Nodosilinea sp. TSF1-S3]MDF0364759.1 pentapeptide repeat-containing protein [Nodosilinea sp. TSF1-S3]
MSQGKYQGKRLSATDVTRLYAAGERDFRGAVLRGCNFYGVDLSGADLSGADIRSANFSLTLLIDTNFAKAKCGVQKRWLLAKIALVAWFSTLFAAVSSAAKDSYLKSFVSPEHAVQNIELTYYLVFASNLVIFLILIEKAFSARSSIFIALFGLTSGITLINHLGASRGFGILALLGIIFIFISPFSFPSKTLTPNIAMPFALTAISVVIVFVASTLAIGIVQTLFFIRYNPRYHPSENIFLGWGENLGWAAFVLTPLLFFVFISVWREGGNFIWITKVIKLFSVESGTAFYGSNLSAANFTSANLKRASFSNWDIGPANMFRTRLKNVAGLDYAWLGSDILEDYRSRQLLITLDGTDQDLTGADLRGANLAGAKLHRAIFKSANLKGALLKGAELHGANLTEANCVGTDFNGAYFTGACLEAWNIDNTTNLQGIDCKYVFLLEQPDARGGRKRRPHDPDKIFQPGDFEKFFREMLDTVQILIRNGVDPQAFKKAFEKVMGEYPSVTRDSIQAMEKQGNDVLLTLQVPEGIDKGKLERTWDKGYQLGLKEGYTSGLLEGQKQRAEDAKEFTLSIISRFSSPIYINNMNNPINTGDGSFYAGGDVNLSGSTLNLGQISGQVINQINQIPAPATPDQPNLRDIFTQLKTAVETDSELSDDEKAEALQAVARIAAAGTEPNPDDKAKGIVKRATDALKGMTETLTDASKLADACTKLLPLVLSLFALI